ncbi:glycosyltransferase family 4 protein [Aeromicrobium sp. CF3.5]|uniref:glycosyltransferase family 4 protein n=1 Tax=Aeromicrobium sp. CF3.5 TaxID=3373078 RepID=UPI003EE48F76
MRVYIPLPVGTSSRQWADRSAAGEVPDASPYGLHHLHDHGFDVTFGDSELTGVRARAARSVRHRTGGLELVEHHTMSKRMQRRSSDVTLAYDERTGVPAALRGHRRSAAPVVTGVGWLTTRDATAPVQRHLVQRALSRATSVWTQCSAMVPILSAEWDVPEVHYVPVGIDTDFYAEHAWELAGQLVVSAGEDRFRDHDLLIDAVHRVRRQLPDLRFELATALPVSIDPALDTLHTERMGGRMRDLYARSSVVAVALRPTPTGSGLTVVLEAMASGRPLVVTANPGISDYVVHGETGLLVPPNDPEAFAGALRALLLDPDRCEAMGAAAAQTARRDFTSAAMSASLADLLRRAVG